MRTSQTLGDRIRDKLDTQLVSYFKNKTLPNSGYQLVPILGNSLTMIAAELQGGNGLSWKAWMSEALKIAREERHSVDSLTRRGSTLPEIFSYALDTAGCDTKRYEIWRILFNKAKVLEPTGIHRALVNMANTIGTTNYDDLIEAAAVIEGNYSREHVVLPPAEDPKHFECSMQSFTRIYKLHGSLPFPSVCGKRAEESDFDKWITEEKHKETIATSKTYQKYAYLKKEKFLEKVKDLIEVLNKNETLVLFFGTGLTSDELVLMRLLNELDSLANKCMLVVTYPDDPLHRFKMLGINMIELPIGLVGSPRKRALAFLTFLNLLLERNYINCPNSSQAKAKKALEDGFNECDKDTSLDDKKLSKISPVVCAVGQSAKGRLIGLHEAAAQEAFHSPGLASAVPDGDPEILIVDQVQGQACTPALIWDAIGLPCSLVSEIGDDVPGKEIIDRLVQTEWIDFDGVEQILPDVPDEDKQVLKDKGTNTAPGLATETMTTTTWFGNRTGFDCYRQFEVRGKSFKKTLKSKIACVPIVYATPPYFKEFKETIDNDSNLCPFIIFETGGVGKMEDQEWIADKEGIILSSAIAAGKWFAAKEKKGNEAVATGKEWVKSCNFPKDETGRFHQYYHFLKELKNQPIPTALTQGALQNARALVVTLGELGAIYWNRGSTSWSDPWWCITYEFINNSNNTSEEMRVLPLEEVRDGLGCGDSARAGFVAAVACLTNFQGVRKGKTLPKRSIDMAVAWLNWFGLQKLRHFGLENYLKFLRENSIKLQVALKKNKFNGGIVNLGTGDEWEKMSIVRASCGGSQLHEKLEDYIKDAPKLAKVKDLAKSWEGKRQIKSSR